MSSVLRAEESWISFSSSFDGDISLRHGQTFFINDGFGQEAEHCLLWDEERYAEISQRNVFLTTSTGRLSSEVYSHVEFVWSSGEEASREVRQLYSLSSVEPPEGRLELDGLNPETPSWTCTVYLYEDGVRINQQFARQTYRIEREDSPYVVYAKPSAVYEESKGELHGNFWGDENGDGIQENEESFISGDFVPEVTLSGNGLRKTIRLEHYWRPFHFMRIPDGEYELSFRLVEGNIEHFKGSDFKQGDDLTKDSDFPEWNGSSFPSHSTTIVIEDGKVMRNFGIGVYAKPQWDGITNIGLQTVSEDNGRFFGRMYFDKPIRERLDIAFLTYFPELTTATLNSDFRIPSDSSLISTVAGENYVDYSVQIINDAAVESTEVVHLLFDELLANDEVVFEDMQTQISILDDDRVTPLVPDDYCQVAYDFVDFFQVGSDRFQGQRMSIFGEIETLRLEKEDVIELGDEITNFGISDFFLGLSLKAEEYDDYYFSFEWRILRLSGTGNFVIGDIADSESSIQYTGFSDFPNGWNSYGARHVHGDETRLILGFVDLNDPDFPPDDVGIEIRNFRLYFPCDDPGGDGGDGGDGGNPPTFAEELEELGLTGSQREPSADPFQRGVANALAHALGIFGVAPLTSMERQRMPVLASSTGNVRGAMSFIRPADVPEDVVYCIEVSTSLNPEQWDEVAKKSANGDWTGSMIPAEKDKEAGLVKVTVDFPPSYDFETKGFMRLRILLED